MAILSVLIPAYNYPDGVRNILSTLSHNTSSELEIIIADDSSNEFVSQAVDAFRHLFLVNFNYRRNYPALGAVSNWNSLLDQASGEFVLLLHHDEFPLSEDFLSSVVGLLNKSPDADVLIMDCILFERGGRCRRHIPMWLRMVVAQWCPNYLWRRNVIGPASTMIVRRSIYPRYDMALRWLVDVDLYIRMFAAAKKIVSCKNIKIGSQIERDDSITSGIRHELDDIAMSERNYLRDRAFIQSVWLKNGIFPGFFRVVESMIWMVFRLAQRSFGVFVLTK